MLKILICKITFIFSIFFFLLTSCKSSKQIYKGYIIGTSLGTYTNQSLDFDIDAWATEAAVTEDSIENAIQKLPISFSKIIKKPFKNKATCLFITKSKYTLNLVESGLVYKKISSLNNFSAGISVSLAKNIRLDSFFSANEVSKSSSSFFQLPDAHYFLKNQVNQLDYQITDNGMRYRLRELHFVYKDSFILRFIWIGDISKIKKSIDYPDYWLTTFNWNTEICYLMFRDSAQYRIKDLPKNVFINSEEVLKTKGYLASIEYLNSLNQSFKKEGNPMQKSMYYQALMTYQSFVGNHTLSLAYADSAITYKPPFLPKSELSQDFSFTNASEDIIAVCKNKKIVMFNEAHHIPQSRAFMMSMLRNFYLQGFKYIAIESLDGKDSLINKRQYPTQKSGYYVAEPTFGNMIREALKIGFKVYAYDDNSECDKPDDRFYCSNKRDSIAADNILKPIIEDKNAKILVWAGYSHISKTKNDKIMGIRLAKRVEMMTGVEPFTIEQTLFREKSDINFENGFYRLVTEKWNFKSPILLKKGNEFWVRPEDKGVYDLEVFFPRTEYKNGIPLWQYSKDAMPYYIYFPKNKIIKNEILQVYVKNEYEQEKDNAVPVLNHFITETPISDLKIYLQKGNYILLARDISNKVDLTEEISVK